MTLSIQGDPSTIKIDGKATNGLSGVNNSLAYRIGEAERHFHSYESWFGLAGAPNGEIHVADRVGVTENPFVVDAGNSTWGAWVQVLGSSDTPARDTNLKYDLHRILLSDFERNATVHFFQVAFGASGALALAAGDYTEFVYEPPAAGAEEGPVDIHMRRKNAETKAWIRIYIPGQDTGTVSFFIGIHEYEG